MTANAVHVSLSWEWYSKDVSDGQILFVAAGGAPVAAAQINAMCHVGARPQDFIQGMAKGKPRPEGRGGVGFSGGGGGLRAIIHK